MAQRKHEATYRLFFPRPVNTRNDSCVERNAYILAAVYLAGAIVPVPAVAMSSSAVEGNNKIDTDIIIISRVCKCAGDADNGPLIKGTSYVAPGAYVIMYNIMGNTIIIMYSNNVYEWRTRGSFARPPFASENRVRPAAATRPAGRDSSVSRQRI